MNKVIKTVLPKSYTLNTIVAAHAFWPSSSEIY